MVIVGTHIDKMRNFGKKSRTEFTNLINELYSSIQKYPPIKAIKFVSCQERFEDTIKDLQDTIYDIAAETKLFLGKLGITRYHYLT